VQNLLVTLRNRESSRVAAEIETDTHLRYHPVSDGQSVSGIYRRSLILASGRFALLQDATSFALVPWRPIIEPQLGVEARPSRDRDLLPDICPHTSLGMACSAMTGRNRATLNRSSR
jgi:hypothetical protein